MTSLTIDRFQISQFKFHRNESERIILIQFLEINNNLQAGIIFQMIRYLFISSQFIACPPITSSIHYTITNCKMFPSFFL